MRRVFVQYQDGQSAEWTADQTRVPQGGRLMVLHDVITESGQKWETLLVPLTNVRYVMERRV